MPSINTDVKNTREKVVDVEYKLKNGDTKRLKLNVKYRERVCYYRYDGVNEIRDESVLSFDYLKFKESNNNKVYVKK